VAELGVDMGRFPTAAHAASWTGICPGNNERQAPQRNQPKGNRWLRTALVECAHGAVRKKDSYFRAQYQRLAPRRGGKRAIVAVAHSILVAAYQGLRDGTEYRDAGPRHFDTLQRDRLTCNHVRRLSDLGHQVGVKQKRPPPDTTLAREPSEDPPRRPPSCWSGTTWTTTASSPPLRSPLCTPARSCQHAWCRLASPARPVPPDPGRCRDAASGAAKSVAMAIRRTATSRAVCRPGGVEITRCHPGEVMS
jgi:hypothetical protein